MELGPNPRSRGGTAGTSGGSRAGMSGSGEGGGDRVDRCRWRG
jgi:hypothetical protein